MNSGRRSARWLLLSLPLTLALIHSGAFFDPFSAPKNAAFLLITAIIAAFTLISLPALQRFQFKRPLPIAAAIFLCINLAAAIASSRPVLSLNAFAFTVCGVVLVTAAIQLLSRADAATKIRNLHIAITGSATLVALITIAQFFGFTTFGIDASSASRMRMSATLGNPDFVATFLAIALPAAIASALAPARLRAPTTLLIRAANTTAPCPILSRFFWRKGGKPPNYLRAGSMASLLIALAILLTGSRCGIFAMTIGLAVHVLTSRPRHPRIRLAIAAATLLICSVAVTTTFNARTPSEVLRGRLFIWQVTLTDHAILQPLGTGLGTFAYNYPFNLGRYFSDPAHLPLLRFASHEQHAQNDFLEALHDTGWLGLASLLTVLAAWLIAALRILRSSASDTRPDTACAIASVAAFCAAALFDFPLHRADSLVLLCLSMAIPFASANQLSATQPRIPWPRYAAAAIILLLGSYFALAPLAASYQLALGASAESNQQFQQAIASYQNALRLQPSSPDANFNLVRALAETGDFDRALTQSIAAERYVNEPELYLLRVRILQNLDRDNEALRELNQGIRLFPYSKSLRKEIAVRDPSHTETSPH